MSEKSTLLEKVLKVLDEMQASDVVVMDVRLQTSVTDDMIVCTGRSSRHVKSIAEEVMLVLKQSGMPALHETGLETGEWALIDFGDVVLHVMQAQTRLFYNLEGLWLSC